MKKLFFAICCLLLMLPTLVSCTNDNHGFVGSPDAVEIKNSDLGSYKVVFPIRFDMDATTVMEDFVRDLDGMTGIRLVMQHDKKDGQDKEIIFGEAERDAVAPAIEGKSFRTEDFYLAAKDGKFLIYAETAAAYERAAEFILNNCVSESGSLWFPKDYLYQHTYPIDILKIDDTVVNGESYDVIDRGAGTELTRKVSNRLSFLTGYEYYTSLKAYRKHVFLGERLDASNTAPFLIELDDDGNIYVSAVPASGMEKAVDLFFYHVLGYDSVHDPEAKDSVVFSPIPRYRAFTLTDYAALKDLQNAGRPTAILYVTPNATGGDGSEASPLGTVKEAYDAAVALINAGTAMDITIKLTSGVHILDEEIVIDGSKITAESYSIHFSGATALPEDTTVTSNVDIPGSYFTKVDGEDYYMYQLPESAKDENGEFPLFRDLYVDGEALTLAATERDRYVMLFDTCKSAVANGFSDSDHKLYVTRAAVAGVEVDEDYNVIGDLELWVKTEWQVHAVHVEKVLFDDKCPLEDTDNGGYLVPVVIRESEWSTFKEGYYSSLKNRPYWMANNIRYLSAGEFYYDHANGVIYCQPTESMENVTISYPQTERLFHLKDAENISFSNMYMHGVTVNIVTTFGYVTGQGGYIKIKDPETGKQFGFLPYGAIYGKNVKNILIENCNISNVGDDAINFRGGVSEVTITGCVIENTGGSAIRFGENTSEYSDKKYNRDINITNNYIRNTGMTFTSNPGILIASVLNLELSHNHILESCYSGISIGWSWSSQADNANADAESFVNVKNANVAYNYIEDFMTGMADGGAIYVLGGNASAKTEEYLNSMNNNLVILRSNVAAGGRAWTVFYHDSGASHWHDYDNMILTEEDMRAPYFSYVSYQTNDDGYQNLTEKLYVVGYPADDMSEEMPGAHVATGKTSNQPYYTKDENGNIKTNYTLYGHYSVYNPENGSYDIGNPYNEVVLYKQDGSIKHSRPNNNRFREIYLYTGYDDPNITDEAYAAIERIFESAGCDHVGKNWDFGEHPPYSGD